MYVILFTLPNPPASTLPMYPLPSILNMEPTAQLHASLPPFSFLLAHTLTRAHTQPWPQSARYLLVSEVEAWPDLVGVVTGGLAGVQQPLQLEDVEEGVLDGGRLLQGASQADWRPRAAPGEAGHECHRSPEPVAGTHLRGGRRPGSPRGERGEAGRVSRWQLPAEAGV